ncbi:MAG: oxygen-dependent coproporphyrinogen oxidase [Cyclonatronaceae bacterium]
MREQFTEWIHDLQNRICSALEELDGVERFREDSWERPGGGGGHTRVIANGGVFEKGGVNTSVVHGELPELIRKRFNVEGGYFFAAGISLVLHPENPYVPTVHANFRYFEIRDAESGPASDSWFGGGADLTPYILFDEDAAHFHTVLKKACDRHHAGFYPEFKKECDTYFHNTHRRESRGIGGLFFDYLRAGDSFTKEDRFAFVRDAGEAFLPSYLPIAERRMHHGWTEAERYWQEIRRGRYVEFNLIHDRGTLFGLKTDGRVESILMSLPPRVRWDYDFRPEPGSREEELIAVLREPREWVIEK